MSISRVEVYDGDHHLVGQSTLRPATQRERETQPNDRPDSARWIDEVTIPAGGYVVFLGSSDAPPVRVP